MEIVVIGSLLAIVNGLMLWVLTGIRSDVKDIRDEVRSVSETTNKHEVQIDTIQKQTDKNSDCVEKLRGQVLVYGNYNKAL